MFPVILSVHLQNITAVKELMYKTLLNFPFNANSTAPNMSKQTRFLCPAINWITVHAFYTENKTSNA